MQNLKDNIIGLTLGIRFSRSFRIPDISGDIIDNILYSDKSPFGTDFFPRIQEKTGREKILLHSDEQGNADRYLRINTDDLILAIEIDKDFEKKFAWLKNNVLNYFQNDLFNSYKIKNIRRLGIIFSHKIPKNKKINEAVSLLTDKEVEDPDNINISFSKKASALDALYRKGVSDYKNTIYNLQEFKEAIFAELDYQYYYEPAIEDLRECFADKILDDSKNFLENKFYSWLSKYENEKNK